jgi:hypothetical protein
VVRLESVEYSRATDASWHYVMLCGLFYSQAYYKASSMCFVIEVGLVQNDAIYVKSQFQFPLIRGLAHNNVEQSFLANIKFFLLG